jgi:MFS family permease
MLAMPFTGRLTDRVGGGRVALVGLAILTVATIPFAVVDPATPYAWLASVLFVRGVGIGATMMPAMAAAYATLDHSEIPRATSALNVLQRIGGSLGTALLAVVLQHQLTARLGGGAGGTLGQVPDQVRLRIGDSLAAAFAHTFWWAVAIGVVGLVPTAILAVVQTRERQPGTAEVAPEAVG